MAKRGKGGEGRGERAKGEARGENFVLLDVAFSRMSRSVIL